MFPLFLIWQGVAGASCNAPIEFPSPGKLAPPHIRSSPTLAPAQTQSPYARHRLQWDCKLEQFESAVMSSGSFAGGGSVVHGGGVCGAQQGDDKSWDYCSFL